MVQWLSPFSACVMLLFFWDSQWVWIKVQSLLLSSPASLRRFTVSVPPSNIKASRKWKITLILLHNLRNRIDLLHVLKLFLIVLYYTCDSKNYTKFQWLFLLNSTIEKGSIRWYINWNKRSTVGMHVFKYAQGNKNLKNIFLRGVKKNEVCYY